jgi:hypothetical protein
MIIINDLHINMLNTLKYQSYKTANNLLIEAKKNQDIPRCIAAIVICESIISDRMQSYLMYTNSSIMINKGKSRKHVSANEMTKECQKHFPKHYISVNSSKHGKTMSSNLFESIQLWLECRNDICHGFVKTKPGTPSKEIRNFHKEAIKAAEEGFILTKLVSKWHKQIHLTNKKK